MKTCENCNKEHDGTYGSGRFCSKECARGFSTKNKRKEINEKTSNSLKGRKLSDEHRDKISKIQSGKVMSENTKNKISNTKKGIARTEEEKTNIAIGMLKSNGKEINSILDVSSRTVTKILTRMNIGCSRCGWKESTCDIHHINGRKIEDFNNNNNLSLICPNCHRLVHTGKIKKEELIPLSIYIGDKWKAYYNK